MLRIVGLIIALSVLDAGAAILVKEAQARRSPLLLLAALTVLIAVAAILYVSVSLAELTFISIGWIVVYQVVVMLYDHLHNEVTFTFTQVVAICIAVTALCIALLPPETTEPDDHDHSDHGELVGRHRAFPSQRTINTSEGIR